MKEFNKSIIEESQYYGLRNEELAKVEITVLAILFIAIVISNLFVMVALVRSSLIRPLSRTYLFMMHLSVADLLVGLLSVLPQLCWDVTFRFRGTDWLCRLVKWAQMMPVYLSSLLLMFMAIDRYRAISWRRGGALGIRSSKKVVRYMVGFAWILASLLAFPQIFIFSKVLLPDGNWDCWASHSRESSQIYVVYYCVAAFLFPFLLILFSYSFIVVKMWQFTRYRKGYMPLRQVLLRRLLCIGKEEDGNHERCSETSTASTMSYRYGRSMTGWQPHPEVPQPLSRAKVKTIRLTFVIVAAFIACNAPFCFTQLYFAFSQESEDDSQVSHPMTILMLLLPSLPSCANPWIYLCFSESLLNQIRVCFGQNQRPRIKRVSIGEQEPDDQKCQRIRVPPCTPPDDQMPNLPGIKDILLKVSTDNRSQVM